VSTYERTSRSLLLLGLSCACDTASVS
jgi:hypothetical protein